jgi:hypothetical protein
VTGTATLPTITGLTNGNVNITANGTGTVNLDNLTVKNTTINSISSGNVVQFGGTFGVAVPYGNTLERPGNTTFVGTTRWNTLLETLETWSGNTWVSGGSVPLGAVVDQQITPDGTSVAYTLNQSATNTNIIVSINGILQLPGVAYNAAGTTITFAQAPLTNDIVDIRFIAYTSTLSALTNSSGNAYVVVNDDSTINFATSGATAVDIDASGNLNANIINANSVHTGNILTDNYLYANGSPYTPGNAVSSEQINTTNFSFKQASGKLIFYFGNTEIASLDSAGNFTTTGNISAHGTP